MSASPESSEPSARPLGAANVRRSPRLSLAVLRCLLLAFPLRFRERFGAELVHTFEDRHADLVADARTAWPIAKAWRRTLPDLLLASARERLAQLLPWASGERGGFRDHSGSFSPRSPRNRMGNLA